MSKILSIFILFLSISVQAALPKELPTAPAKFLTGACLTRSEDLWITAEAGGTVRLPRNGLHIEMVHASGIHEQTRLDLAERIFSRKLSIKNRFEPTDGGKMFAVKAAGIATLFSKRYRGTNLKSCWKML